MQVGASSRLIHVEVERWVQGKRSKLRPKVEVAVQESLAILSSDAMRSSIQHSESAGERYERSRTSASIPVLREHGLSEKGQPSLHDGLVQIIHPIPIRSDQRPALFHGLVQPSVAGELLCRVIALDDGMNERL
jgi:hypothetical protein